MAGACLIALVLGGCASQNMSSTAWPAARTVDAGTLEATQVGAGEHVAQMTLGDNGTRLYVTGNADNTLTVINTQTHQVERTIDGGTFETGLGGCPDNFCKGRGAAGVAITPGGHTALVSSMRPDAVSRIDLATGQITANADVARFPRDIAISSDGQRAYIMNSVANSVSALDVKTMTPVGEPIALIGGDARYLPFGRYIGMWLSPNDRKLFVYNAKRDTIDRFDTKTLEQDQADEVRYRFQTLVASPSRSRVAIADKNGVSIVDGNTLELQKRLSYCGYGPRDYPTMALSRGGRYLAFHTSRSANTWVIDTQSGEAVRRYPAKDFVMGLLFSPNDATLYALNGDDTVSFFDTATTQALEDDRRSTAPRFCTPFKTMSVTEEKQAR
ncbi:hypothetical protein D3260_08665 [Salinisphaera sp. Q1T1-3]|nr:hypothetical protein D3260_08665 [Salinisphaera sp. Q1T1-3]